MADRSESLGEAEDRRPLNLQRSRSGGYADHLAEVMTWDRRNSNSDIRRFPDDSCDSASAPPTRPSSSRLSVPVFEYANNSRRNRSTSETLRRREDSSLGFHSQEARSKPRPVSDYIMASPPLSRSESRAAQRDFRQRHLKRPSIKVQIHQDNAPIAFTSTNPSPKRIPTASPHSPRSPLSPRSQSPPLAE